MIAAKNRIKVETPILGDGVRTYSLLKHSLNLQQAMYLLGSVHSSCVRMFVQ